MWRDVARLSTGTAVGQALVVASTPLLTRIYPPEAFGKFGLFLSFASVAMVFVGLRYDLAIASASGDAESDELLATALLASVPTSVLAATCLWLMIAGDVLGLAALPVISVPVIGGLLLATGAVMALRYWNVRAFRFRVVATASALQGFGRAIVPLAFAAAGPGWWGLLAGDAAGRLLGAASLARGAATRLRGTSAAAIAAAARRYWRYPAVIMPSSGLDAIAVALPLPLVSTLFGVGAAGQFALVQRVAAVPASLIAASFADAIHAEGSRIRETDQSQLRTLALQSARRLGLLGAAIYVPMLILAPSAFPLLFGHEWREAGVLAAILTPFLWLTLIVSPLSRLILVTGRTGLKLLADLVCLVLPSSALLVGRDLGFTWAVATFSLASTLAYLFYLGIIWLAIRDRRLSTGH
jgi:O-antigen/teichoic acid export membrane protein